VHPTGATYSHRHSCKALPRTLPDTYNPLVVSLDESIKLDQNQPNMVPSVTLPNGKISYPQHVNSSKEIRQLGEQLKAEALQLIEISNKVKISIQLNIPKIESGGDFGVQIRNYDFFFFFNKLICILFCCRGGDRGRAVPCRGQRLFHP